MSQNGSSAISTTESYYDDIAEQFQFPSHYKLLGQLGMGGFGMVVKCFNTETQQVLAVKIQDDDTITGNELLMMELLMDNNLHENNIIRFFEVLQLQGDYWGLVYELLDITLQQRLVHDYTITPLDLQSIRSVIQQLAVALDSLKSLEVIHSDIKPDNIMLVDAEEQPLQVRLIDFGLALLTSRAEQGGNLQPLDYMAPEIILGLPFSEAIDMWSLGIVMMVILTGDSPFAANDKYGQLANMVEILGFQSDHLLEAGLYTNLYFNRSQTGQWVLKTPEEYWMDLPLPEDVRIFSISSLDQVKLLPLSNLDGVDDVEMKECIDLLKAMLTFDADQRITPSQVLTHPFIVRGNPQQSSVENTKNNQKQGDISMETARPGTAATGQEQPSVLSVSPVQPAPTVCCLSQDKNQELSCSHSNELLEPPHLCVKTIVVKPAPPESSLELDEDTEADLPCLIEQPSPLLYSEESSASDDTDPEDVQPSETKNRKRKNVFTRFRHWVKKRFLCCSNAVDVMD